MLSSHFLKGYSIIQLKKKMHLLFRSYFKKKIFLRRVAQYWKSLLREVINSLSKKVFKAELETTAAGMSAVWNGGKCRTNLAVLYFLKPAAAREMGTLHFSLGRHLSVSDTSSQQKKLQ